MPTLTKTNGKKGAPANGKGRATNDTKAKEGSASLPRRLQDYNVKDISLAEWGRKEISVAEQEMPS